MVQTKKQILTNAFGDYEKLLLKRSHYKVTDGDLADDLVQTTFLKTWEYLIKHGKVDSMKAFLFHVLNNLIIDEYRKHKPLSLDILTDGGLQLRNDECDRLYDIFDGQTAVLLIPLLSEKYRKVITMRYIDDMSLTEISEKTKQTKNTVTVQLSRGMEKLAILFKARY